MQERELQKQRRDTEYPACVKICDVREVWGEEGCRLICPNKFEGEKR
jgi:hypothetical protein